MEAAEDFELVINQYIVNLDELLVKFTKHANEELSRITDDLNRCQANLTILEKKIEASRLN